MILEKKWYYPIFVLLIAGVALYAHTFWFATVVFSFI